MTPFGVENLTVRYRAGRGSPHGRGETSPPALAGVTLDVPAGCITCLTGGDGAGKTTLLRALAGAVAPAQGFVRRPPARELGYMPAGAGVYGDLSVEENVAFAAAVQGLAPAEALSRAGELLSRTGLLLARSRPARALSGGMRQKLGVVCAMIHRPRLLLLDEPTTGVDPVSRAELWWLFARAAADGAAVLVAVPDPVEAERAAQVAFLHEGRLLACGTPEEIARSVPGEVRRLPGRPAGEDARRSWRRGAEWRLWRPWRSDGAERAPAGEPVVPDLQDALTVLALRAEELGEGEGAEAARPEARRMAHPRGSEPLAQAQGVVRRFGDVLAVAGVDLTVAAGEVVGLLGANGAGKTTLIRMLLGLLPPSKGEVRLFGRPPSRGALARVGYVPQGLGLYEDLTVRENAAFAARVLGLRPAELPAALAERADVLVGDLPLGLRRRLAFAIALAPQPDLLVLDEPTSGVDPVERARLWEAIRQAAEAGAGVGVTTHYMSEADACDRLLVMSEGRVVASGTPRELVAGREVAVVETDDWPRALSSLEAAGFRPALVGRTLRVAGPSAAGESGEALVAAVAGALREVPHEVRLRPATLEERFAELSKEVPAPLA